MAAALLVWGLIVGFLAGGHLATDGKIKVKTIKAEAPKASYLTPCIGKVQPNEQCDRP